MSSPLPPGERLVRCLTGGDVDRVPFGVNLGWVPWGDTEARWKEQGAPADLRLAAYFQYDLGFLCPDRIECGMFPHFEEKILGENDEEIVAQDWRGVVCRSRKDGNSIPHFEGWPVATADDWERVKRERLRIEDADRRVAAQDWDAFRTRLRATGEAVQVGNFPWGVFGTPRDILGLETLMVSFYEQPEVVRDIMEHMTSLWLAVWERVAAHVRIDHIHIWEDMSGKHGSLVSPAMVGEFMMPCYDRIRDFAAAHDVRVMSVDTDGDCSQLVEIMTRHGVNMFFPFEVQAGNDILAYRSRYPELGIQCGLDKRCLAGTAEDVDREVARCEAMLAHGRYVPGFDHLIPPDARWERFEQAASAIRALCLRPR
ncbi:MAG: uroporphyrinogen decarboxylase family protein [Kiritimatiellia bacterium]|jgi:hypothetical protein